MLDVLAENGIGKGLNMSTMRLAPRTIVKLGYAASEPGHLVGRSGYRTLCGESITRTVCAGSAITCHTCSATAAQAR